HNDLLYVVNEHIDKIDIFIIDDHHIQVGNCIKTEADAKPHHIIFHPNKSLAFLRNELNSTTNVYRIHVLCEQSEYL
ncbi:unnamed protein product, partial [Rotaria sp. Silwood2]